MAVHQLDNGNPDGTQLGSASTALIGFWGATPAAQPSITAVATTTATTTLNETKIDRLYSALRTAGIINTGG